MDIDPIRPSTLNALAAIEQERCISILMPTHTTGRESRQDPIRLGNLLDQVRSQLKSQQIRSPDIEAFLQPAQELVNQHRFWQFQGASLAVYLASGVVRLLRLPVAVDESVTIASHFNIKPLLGSMASSQPFYVLALTKEQSRLYRGTRTDLEEVHAEGFPLIAAEEVGVREPGQELQHHGGRAPVGGRGFRGNRGDAGQANYHGQGEGEGKIEADMIHFFKTTADHVAKFLYGDDTPLVLAADISLVGWYRREHYRGRLIESDHLESPDALKPHEIREQAWKIAASSLEADLSKLLDRFGTAAAEGRAAQGYAEVASAAAQGKVDTLFFDPRATQLGRLTDGGTTVQLVDDADGSAAAQSAEKTAEEAAAEDLVNRAIIDTLRASGRAVPLAAARGRDDRDAAPQPPKAILRY